MTRKEAERQNRQSDTLRSLGFTREEAEALRRISVRLQQWYEKECGNDYGCIERDETTGKTYWRSAIFGGRSPIRDLETGAVNRLKAIVAVRNARLASLNFPAASDDQKAEYAKAGGELAYYLQTDPRGAALYILRAGDVPEGEDPAAYYTRGIVIY